MRTKPNFSMICALTAASLVGVSVASAQPVKNTEPAVSLEPLQVIPQAMADVRTVSVIGAEHIQEVQAVTLGDVFRVDPEVSVGGGGTPAAQKIYVRGLEDAMLNVQIDGARQPAQVYHHQTRLLLDPELIKRVEVEPGGGPATSGPGALGGSIRFETKSASDLLEPGQAAGGLMKLGGQTNGEGYSALLGAFGRITDSLNLLAAVSHHDADSYEDGDGEEVENTEFERTSVFVKADGTVGEEHAYTLSYNRYLDEGPRRVRANFTGDIRHPVLPNPVTDQEAVRETATFTYGFVPQDTDKVDLEFTAYTTESTSAQESLEPFVSGPPFFQNETFDFDLENRSSGLDLRNTGRYEFHGRHNVTVGTDYRRDEAEFRNQSTGANPFSFANWRDGDEEGEVFGLYVQETWWVTPRVVVSTGTRWDSYSYTDRDDQEVTSDGFSPNFGLKVEAVEGLEVYGSVTRAVRGMTVGEALWIGDRRKEVDPDADPETALNREVGATYTRGSWTLNGKVYRQDIDGYIGYLDRTNLGDVEIPGYSASAGYRKDAWLASVSMNYADPELDGKPLINETDIGLGASSGRTWITKVEYTFPEREISLGWNGRFVEELDDLPEGHPDKPGFGVHDFYLRWACEKVEGLTVTFVVKNAFDKDYAEHTSYGYNSSVDGIVGLPEPGRDLRLAFAYKF